MTSSSTPWCIAHRGARDEAPDNTRSAFMHALDYPIDGIELDVQMSADAVPVLYHDSTLLRVGGGRKRVSALTFSQLQELDWGGWFHPDFSREPLMRLEELMPMLERCPRLLIEIKSNPGEHAGGHVFRLTEKVISLITQPQYHAYQDRLFILSFDPEILSAAHKLAPALPKVLNLTGKEPYTVMDESPFIWAVDVQIGELTEAFVRNARSRNLSVMSYTCNSQRQVAKAMRLGIDAIISDRPGWLTRHLSRR